MAVLYRTYRPSKWSEIMGQDHIVNALKDAITNKRTAHAYLFSGSRGTGKTSTARILARELKTADEDVYEIDAASILGIDNFRELREHVSVLPFSSPYKVYIIDEVHMLSKEAWNPLLKTLEEPPKHVVFVLATTESDKVPETIVSRCQTFTFRKPGREILRKELQRIATKEGIIIDAGATDLLALLGDGSFRDALGMLEKVIAASKDKKITREEVENIAGAPKASLINDFISHLLTKNADQALNVITRAEESGLSMNTFITLTLEKLRFILLAQHSKISESAVKERVSPDDFESISIQSSKNLLTPAILSTLLEAAEATARARIEQLPLELAVVKICG